MNITDAVKEIEVIVKDLCKWAGKQDKYALVVVDEIKKGLDELNQLKTIEEELGVDLITLFKASKQGIFIKKQNTNEKEIDFEEITLDLDNKLLLFRHPRKEIGKGRVLSQYGRTWSLTREELENDKQ